MVALLIVWLAGVRRGALLSGERAGMMVRLPFSIPVWCGILHLCILGVLAWLDLAGPDLPASLQTSPSLTIQARDGTHGIPSARPSLAAGKMATSAAGLEAEPHAVRQRNWSTIGLDVMYFLGLVLLVAVTFT